MSIHKVPGLIRELYDITNRLGELFPRPFTPDGHLVGSIGEVVAAYLYDLELEPCSNPGWDARTKQSDKKVEIKLTGGDQININQQDAYADLLVVLKLQKPPRFEEVYAGPFPDHALTDKKVSKGNFYTISLSKLRKLDCHELETDGRLEELNSGFMEVPI